MQACWQCLRPVSPAPGGHVPEQPGSIWDETGSDHCSSPAHGGSGYPESIPSGTPTQHEGYDPSSFSGCEHVAGFRLRREDIPLALHSLQG